MATKNNLLGMNPFTWTTAWNHHAQAAIHLCDTRGESEEAPRWWAIWTCCTCSEASCACPKDRPHFHRFGKLVTKEEAMALSKKGALCVDCGG